MKIYVHIDQLVLDGLPVERHSAPLIQEIVQAELGRLFAESGASASLLTGGAIPALRTASVHIDTRTEPDALGHTIAHAVHGGLQQ